MAAVEAFAATRTARRQLDNPGRLGADAVVRARPISGARRASARAQTAMEMSAAQLEKARDRWGALMRGLAADIDLGPEELVPRVETAAIRLAVLEAQQALGAALESARALPSPDSELGSRLRQALGILETIAREVSGGDRTSAP
ncbi:MAG: hypothetical protein ACYCYK_11150 [Candidatus Dormibacteria bacterium]